MRRTCVRGTIAIAAALIATAAADLEAQQRRRATPAVPAQAELGIRGGRDFEADAWMMGMQFRMPLGPWGRVALVPNADLIFLDDATAWQVNIDAGFDLLPEGMLYGGGGYAILGTEVEGERERFNGWNLFVGVKPPMYSVQVRPYIEGRWTLLSDSTVFRLNFGLNVPIGPWRAPPSTRR